MNKVLRDIQRQTREKDVPTHRNEKLIISSRHKHLLDLKSISRSLMTGLNKTSKNGLNDINKDDLAGTRRRLVPTMIFNNGFWHKNREVFKLVAIGIIIVVILNTINLYYQALDKKDKVLSAALAGFGELNALTEITKEQNNHNLAGIFLRAKENFNEAQKELWLISEDRFFLLKEESLMKTAQNLILAGKYLATGGESLVAEGEKLNLIFSEVMANFNREKVIGASVTAKISEELNNLEKVATNFYKTEELLFNVKVDILPDNLKPKFLSVKEKIEKLNAFSKQLFAFKPQFLSILGDRYPQKYLIMLANNNEVRPIMGFLGSGILADLNDGFLTKMNFFDVYDFDGQIKEQFPVPPVFEKLTQNWGLRDSNYSPHYPISAEKAAYFLEKGGGGGVDHVITLDLYIVKEMLKKIGPVPIAGIDIPITSENFDTILSILVEAKVTGEKSPKKILETFINNFIEKIKREKAWTQIGETLRQAINEKHLAVYAKDEEDEKLFRFLGMGGELSPAGPNDDYLAVINTSIGGNKSDKYIEQKIYHQTFVESDGALYNQVTIERTNRWNEEEEKKLVDMAKKLGIDPLSETLKEILGRGFNIVSARIYVPKGSTLKENMGGEKAEDIIERLDPDVDKTYFQTTITTKPGETSRITFIFALPFKMDFDNQTELADYHLIMEKQSGSSGDHFRKELILGGKLNLFTSYPKVYLDGKKAIHEGDLVKNAEFSAVVGR